LRKVGNAGSMILREVEGNDQGVRTWVSIKSNNGSRAADNNKDDPVLVWKDGCPRAPQSAKFQKSAARNGDGRAVRDHAKRVRENFTAPSNEKGSAIEVEGKRLGEMPTLSGGAQQQDQTSHDTPGVEVPGSNPRRRSKRLEKHLIHVERRGRKEGSSYGDQ